MSQPPPFLFASESRGRPGLDGSNVLPTDEAISQAIDTPGSATSDSLLAAIGANTKLGEGLGTVLIGCSIEQGEQDPDRSTAGNFKGHNYGRSYLTLAAAMSGQRIRIIQNSAVSTQTTTQMLARFTADVLDLDPEQVVIGSPINDVINVAWNPTTTRANIMAMVEAAEAHPSVKRVVLTTCTPHDTDGYHAAITAHNAWTAGVVAAGPNRRLWDVHTVLADPSTGDFAAGLSDDGLHPNRAGAWRVASYVAALVSSEPAPSRVDYGSLNLIPIITGSFDNALFIASTGDWGGFGADSETTVTREAVHGCPGQMHKTTILAATATHTDYLNLATGWGAVGDKIRLSGMFATTSFVSGGARGSVQIIFTGADAAYSLVPIENIDTDHPVPIPFSFDMVIPAGTTALSLRKSTRGDTGGKSGTFWIGDLSIVNLTAAGLA